VRCGPRVSNYSMRQQWKLRKRNKKGSGRKKLAEYVCNECVNRRFENPKDKSDHMRIHKRKKAKEVEVDQLRNVKI